MRQLCFKKNEFAQDTVCGLIDAEWPEERTESSNENKERPETSKNGKKHV